MLNEKAPSRPGDQVHFVHVMILVQRKPGKRKCAEVKPGFLLSMLSALLPSVSWDLRSGTRSRTDLESGFVTMTIINRSEI